MLTDDEEQNTQLFFDAAVATGCIWGLQGAEGWALSSSDKYADTLVMPFWSQPEAAQIHCQDGDWADYEVVPIALAEFLDDWLPGMHEDALLVGVNWDEDLAGREYEPLDLLEAFETALA